MDYVSIWLLFQWTVVNNVYMCFTLEAKCCIIRSNPILYKDFELLYVYKHVYIYMYMYVCMYAYMCVYIYVSMYVLLMINYNLI